MRCRAPSSAADDVIRSPANRTLKLIRSLHQRKVRETERAFVVEGFRAIADAIATGATPHIIVVRQGDERNATNWFGSSAAPQAVDAALFDHLAETVSPQGAIAVFPFPDFEIPCVETPLYLVLDQIRDPGNVGTLLRSAAAAGVTAVVLTEGTVDPYNAKAVRAGVGAHFRVPIRWLTELERDRIVRECPVRAVADATGSVPYDEIDWSTGAALIIGSEAHGPSTTGTELGSTTVRIPLAANVESLNAAAAGAVMLFEAARQRRLTATTTTGSTMI